MLWFGMRVVVLVDHLDRRSWLLSIEDPHAPRAYARRQALKALEEASERFSAQDAVSIRPEDVALPATSIRPTSTQQEFEGMVLRALEHIAAGDIFQANVAQRFTGSWQGGSWPLYQRLRRINPSPFACWLSWKDLASA